MSETKPYAPEPRTPYWLAGNADCACPDDLDSPGALFLLGVQSDVVESVNWAVEHDGWDGDAVEDIAAEISDQRVPVYTNDLWATFVDLAAYNEDIDPHNLVRSMVDGPVLEVGARLALYNIAERLATVLLNEAAETLADDEEETPS
jgi:hypothetical protein